MPNCSVLQCNNSSSGVTDKFKASISYHSFPKDAVTRDKWIEATGRQNWTPTRTSRICSQHFDALDLQVVNNGDTRLKEHAVPVHKVGKRSERLSKRNNTEKNQTTTAQETASTSTDVSVRTKRARREAARTSKRVKNHDDVSAGPSLVGATTENIEVKREPTGDENTASEQSMNVTRRRSKRITDSASLTSLQIEQELEDSLEEPVELSENENQRNDIRPSNLGSPESSLPPKIRIPYEKDSDSDFDFEIDIEEMTAITGMISCIPPDDDLDDDERDIVNTVQGAMDNAYEQLDVSADFNWLEDSFRIGPEEFSGPTPGPVEDYNTAYDAFTAIWDREIIQRIVAETNSYANREIEAKIAAGTVRDNSRLHLWTYTNIDEIYRLLAIYVVMGLSRRLQSEYWHHTGCLELTEFKKIMSYDRYILLDKFLHFVNDRSHGFQSGLPAKLQKIAPIVGHLNAKFSSLYNLDKDVVIDEYLTLFKGKPWIQAVSSKPTRAGVKSFELCEHRTGYLYKFDIYTQNNSDDIHALAQGLGRKSAQAVVDLLTELEHRGHRVILDNFFNSPLLARYLKSRGFDCLGTLRPNRKHVPTDIKNIQNAAKGTIVTRHSGDISCVAWRDTKPVTMVTTYHDYACITSKGDQAMVKPKIVKDYTHIMADIDSKNQKLSSFLLEQKRGLKWYIKIFKRLLNVSILNAYILLKLSLQRRNLPILTQREFRIQLAEALVAEHSFRNILRPVENVMRLNTDVVHVPRHHRRIDRKRCVICLSQGVDRKVSLSCVTCGEFLCYGNCWADWHTKEILPGQD